VLDGVVRLDLSGAELEEVAHSLSAPGLGLTAATDVGVRRVTCLGRASRRNWLSAVAYATRLTWTREVSPDGLKYHLGHSRRQREAEDTAVSQAVASLGAARAARRGAMEAAIAAELDRQPPSPIGAALRALSPEDRGALAAITAEPLGVISASDERHLEGRVRTVAGWPGIGIAALEGGLHLVALGEDGGVQSVSSGDPVRRRGLPGTDADLDEPAGGLGAEPRPARLPQGLAARSIRLPRGVDRRDLRSLLVEVSRQAGVPIVATDYLRSSHSQYGWLLTDKPTHLLPEVLDQVTRAFPVDAAYRDGCLVLRSRAPGLDLAVEPPGAALRRWRALRRVDGAFAVADWLALGELSGDQWNTLVRHGRRLLPPRSEIGWLQPFLSPMRFFAALDPSQRAQATAAGLGANDLTPAQRQVLLGVIAFAGPAPAVTGTVIRQHGSTLCLQGADSAGVGRSVTVSFPIASAPNGPPGARR